MSEGRELRRVANCPWPAEERSALDRPYGRVRPHADGRRWVISILRSRDSIPTKGQIDRQRWMVRDAIGNGLVQRAHGDGEMWREPVTLLPSAWVFNERLDKDPVNFESPTRPPKSRVNA